MIYLPNTIEEHLNLFTTCLSSSQVSVLGAKKTEFLLVLLQMDEAGKEIWLSSSLSFKVFN